MKITKTPPLSNKNKNKKHETPVTLCEIQDISRVGTQLLAELEKLTQAYAIMYKQSQPWSFRCNLSVIREPGLPSDLQPIQRLEV